MYCIIIIIKKLNKIIILSLGTIVLFVAVINSASIFVNAQEDNNLASCVDHFINEYNNQMNGLPDSVQQGMNTLVSDDMKNIIAVSMCEIGYEQTGKYSHLLPKEDQAKYAKLAAAKIFLTSQQILQQQQEPVKKRGFSSPLDNYNN